MILNLNLPQEIRDEFKRLYEKDVDVYWNPFLGWLEGGSTALLLDDYPDLSEAQEAILSKIVNHEAEVFEEMQRWATVELDWRNSHPFKLDSNDYPRGLRDDVI